MITLFVTLVIVMALLAMVGWSVFTFQRSTELVAMAQRNSSHMEGIVELLRGSMQYSTDTGLYMLPTGDVTDRMRLPKWVVGDDHAPWGGQYAYCPISGRIDGGASTSVVGGAGTASDYSVTLAAINDVNGVSRSYVAGYSWSGKPSSLTADVVGLVLSPLPLQSTAPDCADVVYSNGYYTISPTASVFGTVSAISAAGIVKNASMSQNTDTVLWVAPAAAGTGAGSDPSNPMAFTQALDYWHVVHPKGTTFNLAAGSYAITETQATFLFGAPVGAPSVAAQRAFVYFVPPSTGTASISGVSGAALTFTFGVNAEFAAGGGGINLASNAGIQVLPNTQIAATIGSLGSLVVDGGNATLSTGSVGTVLVRAGHATVSPAALTNLVVDGGSATVYLTGALSTALTLNGGDLTVGVASSTESFTSAATFSGGNLTLGTGVQANFTSVTFDAGRSSPLRLVLATGATLADTIGGASVSYATVKDFLDNRATVGVTSTSCVADTSANYTNDCTATCPTATPYVIGGDCPPVDGGVLAGFANTPSTWVCKFRTLAASPLDVMRTDGAGTPIAVTTITNLDDGTGGATAPAASSVARCSAVPH